METEGLRKLYSAVFSCRDEPTLVNMRWPAASFSGGSKGKGHGGATMGEIEVPSIMAGAGVIAGREVKHPVNTDDTAATVAYIFGLTAPRCWIARPVEKAFIMNQAARR
jgi:hypothetical protein